jgi:hypothetical protein
MNSAICVCVLISGLAVGVDTQSVKCVRLTLPNEPDAVLANIGQLFARQVQERCGAQVITSGEAPVVVQLCLQADLAPEAYRIDGAAAGVIRIAASDRRGLLFGLGKLLRTSRFGADGFSPGTWRGTSQPLKPVRGIYLATHFHNFYHEAPLEEVERYVEELALWGFNTVLVWYDMHHFPGFDSPEAVAFRERLHRICGAARRLGLDVGLTTVANEGHADSPAAVRADVSGMRGASFASDICISKPEGQEYVLTNFRRLYSWARDLEPKWLVLWPYDSGGCGCSLCRPWGSNGFVTITQPLTALARESLPGVHVVLSTWFFDESEWQAVTAFFAKNQPWVDYALAEGTTRPMPGQLPLVGFPEISMFETFPWGGFGATPLPRHFQSQWDAVKSSSSGGFPYSEGIYEDINKVIFSQFYWSDAPAEQTLREYAAYEFSPDVADDVVQIIATLERNHHWRWWPGMLDGAKLDYDWFPSRGAVRQPDPGAEEAYAIAQRVDAQLSPHARQSWRWRLLYLRALLDAELKTNGGAPNDLCNAAFAELLGIYHAQNANPALRPPLQN